MPNRFAWAYAPTVEAGTLLRHHRICRWTVTVVLGAWTFFVSTVFEILLFELNSDFHWSLVLTAMWIGLGGFVPAVAAGFWAGEVERELLRRGLQFSPHDRVYQLAMRRTWKLLLWMALLVGLVLLFHESTLDKPVTRPGHTPEAAQRQAPSAISSQAGA